jgi:hypothetical protein
MRHIVFLLITVSGAAARADYFTGKTFPIRGPVSSCSVPSAEVPPVANHQVSSEFVYLACKEYRNTATGDLYYSLEAVLDGENIRMLPRPSDPTINPQDYRETVQAAVTTCDRIRTALIKRSVDQSQTPCANQVLSHY